MNATCKVSKRGMLVFCALAASLLAGCGGGGGDGPPPLQTPIGNVSGVWTITEQSQTSPNPECEPPLDPLSDPYPLTVTQSGNNLTVFDGTTTFTGTISGSTISWSGSYPEGAGTTTINSLSVTVEPSCNPLSGTSTWTYVEVGPPAFQCTGAGTFAGTRNVASGCGIEIEPNDTFAQSQVVTFPANVLGSTIGDFSDNVPALDFDIYRFTLASPQTVTITLTGAGQDIDLGLFDSVGGLIASSEGLVSNETITIALGPGTYDAMVAPFLVTATTSYTLNIQ